MLVLSKPCWSLAWSLKRWPGMWKSSSKSLNQHKSTFSGANFLSESSGAPNWWPNFQQTPPRTQTYPQSLGLYDQDLRSDAGAKKTHGKPWEIWWWTMRLGEIWWCLHVPTSVNPKWVSRVRCFLGTILTQSHMAMRNPHVPRENHPWTANSAGCNLGLVGA